MIERIVVCLHLREAGSAASAYLRRALAAKKRAEALGATLCAWAADGLAFDFGAEDVEEAVDLALATFDAELAAPRFSAGVAYGELTRIGTRSSLAMLAWGEPLIIATQLARTAEPGEVLIDARCPEHLAKALRTHDERRVHSDTLTALVLDTRHPFRRDTMIDALGAEDKVRVTVPPLPPILEIALGDRAAASGQRRSEPPPATVRSDKSDADASADADTAEGAAVGADTPGEARLVEVEATLELDTDTSSALPSDGHADAEPSSVAPVTLSEPGLAADVEEPAVETPPLAAPAPPAPPLSATSPTITTLPPSSDPQSAQRLSWPSSDEYVELASAARQALLKGNVAELERLSDELKTRGEHGDLADRMAGFVAWNRGKKAEALRKLRVAADVEARPAHRVRALLAYGVALAASGRTDAALLAALGAIARAREVSDRQGEHVCARFLARLSMAAGYERAARTWAEVADAVEDVRAT